MVNYNIRRGGNYYCTFCDIEVEEVTIKHGLDTSSNDGNGVEEGLSVESVDPVENVETTVRAQCKEVVTEGRTLVRELSNLLFSFKL